MINFFGNIIDRVKLMQQYKKIYCPFFDDFDIRKERFEIIELNIPKEVRDIFVKIKDKNNTEYAKGVRRYNSFKQDITKHNENVQRLKNGMIGFNKDEIINAIQSYDIMKINSYYGIAKELEEYYELSGEAKTFKEEAILLHDDYSIIRNQKYILEKKKDIYKQIPTLQSFHDYFDYRHSKNILDQENELEEILRKYKQFYFDFKPYRNLQRVIDDYNETYVANNISNPLFSDINGKNLDNEQRRAIVTDELSTLVVAGAGSGKTLTICGKVEYLLKEKNDNLKEQLKHAVENEKEAKKDAKHSRMWVYISTGIAFASLIATIIIAIVK